MPIEQSARDEQAVFEPLAELARDRLGHMTQEQCARGEAVVVTRLAASPRRRQSLWLIVALPVAAAAGVLLVAGRYWKHFQPQQEVPLSYRLENDTASNGEPAHGESASRWIRFSDGTEIRVEAGAQAQVRSVSTHGATLVMSRGTLHADVIHSSSSEWHFDAGPFSVQVTGTAFQLAWEPAQDRFDLRLERGAVSVSSPVANAPISLRGGQWLTIRPRSNQVFIRDLETPNAAEPAPSAQPSTTESNVPSAADAGAASHNPVQSRPQHDWARDLARGKAEQIVAEALRLGLDRCLTESSGPEVAALADAARYTRHDEIARKALLTERGRFGGSRRSVDAGLFLGRLSEAKRDDRQALRWFDTYLAEAPAGPYASEALGRKMAIVRRTNGDLAARPLARDYLSRYRDGTYAAAARAILNSP
ncbi:MAG: FecR domain-containing protein [Myxococcales bacterium]